MLLTIEQQKQLYHKLFQVIITKHQENQTKIDLKDFSEPFRNKKWKGIVMLAFDSTIDMVDSVKNNRYLYQWVSQQETKELKHHGIQQALLTVRPEHDCILACSLALEKNHLFIDCIQFRDIA